MKSLDETTLKAINARIINDALGQPPGVALQDLPQGDAERGRLGYALLGLQSAFLRFQQIRVAANYYPWRGRIKRHDHLEMMAHLFLAEVYVYEERLKEYLDACVQCASVWKVTGEFKNFRDDALKTYRAHFKHFIKARNAHTHEADVRFAELSRVSLIDLLSTGDSFRALSIFAPIAFKAAKKRLLNDVDGVIRDSGKLIGLVLRMTKPIWSQL